MGGHARELEDLGGTRSAHSVTLLRRAGGGHETRGTHDGGIFFGSEDFLDTARDEGLDGWEVQVRSEAVEDDELAGLGHGVGLPRSLGE